MIPNYLQDEQTDGRLYGELSYSKRTGKWTINGDAAAVEIAKRLFPGCDGRTRYQARFSANRRIVGELNWLMQRYPLAIKECDRERWQEALREAREFAERREEALSCERRAKPPEVSFSGKLLDYQEKGLAWLLSMRRCLLADEMGLGKTVQALAFLAATGEYPCYLIVPPHLLRNWVNEIGRFLGGNVRVHVIKGLKPYEMPEADIYIIHYLLLRGWKNKLENARPATVIFDEIQELRRNGTGKYSAASLVSSAAKNVIGLSGTPIYNLGGEIWNVVNIIDFHFLGDWESFTRTWCTGYRSGVVAKPQTLGEYLRNEGIMLRRLKKDVLTELKPKRRLVQEIDWDDDVYRELMKETASQLALLDATTDEQQRAIIEEAICQRERKATGCAKAPYVCEFVRALLEAGEKVILAAHHHDVMDIYKKELKKYGPVFVTGREDDKAKAKAVDGFMDGKTDIICLSLRSASGLNLQRATCVVFGELDWSPAVHSQTEDRAHRIGQEDSLLCYYLTSPLGSDRLMQDALGLKVSQFVELMGDSGSVMDDQTAARERIHELVEELRKR